MKIAVGTDHGGYAFKSTLIRTLASAGHRVQDAGAFSPEPCDYPLIGAKVARAVSDGNVQRGVLLCKSGAGMAMVANKFRGVRAVVCQTVALAKHAREHNDANLLVLAAEQTPLKKAKGILKAWLNTPFAGGRHARRLRQIEQIERNVIATPSPSMTLRVNSARGKPSRFKARLPRRPALPAGRDSSQ